MAHSHDSTIMCTSIKYSFLQTKHYPLTKESFKIKSGHDATDRVRDECGSSNPFRLQEFLWEIQTNSLGNPNKLCATGFKISQFHNTGKEKVVFWLSARRQPVVVVVR